MEYLRPSQQLAYGICETWKQYNRKYILLYYLLLDKIEVTKYLDDDSEPTITTGD